VCKTVVGKPEGKIPLARTGRRLKDDTEINFREGVFEGVDWIHPA
jgi:hypothetical protein